MIGEPDLLGVVVGNPVADELHRDGVLVGRACGGTATYATLALRSLGLQSALIGAVGRDHDIMLREPLEMAGVELAGLRVDAVPSTAYVLDYEGEPAQRKVRLQHQGPRIRAQDIPATLPRATFVHVGAVAGEVLPEAVDRLAGWGIPMGIDLHALRRFEPGGMVLIDKADECGIDFGCFDTVKGSVEEILAFNGSSGEPVDALRGIARRGVRNVFATDGRNGALLLADGEPVVIPAFPVTEVDATGAGDVFLAAFLFARHGMGESARDAALFAAAAASFVVEGPGATWLGDRTAVEARRMVLRNM
jgi:ribokinase